MTPPARLQPVQAWAIVSKRGGTLQFDLGIYRCESDARIHLRASDVSEHLKVVRVTVRAWAPPTQKKR